MAVDLVRKITMDSRNEGMIKAMKTGKYLSGTPYYGHDRDEKTQKLKVNKKKASVVKMMFSWLVDDKLSEYKVQQRVNEMKIPTKYDNLGREKKTGSRTSAKGTILK